MRLVPYALFLGFLTGPALADGFCFGRFYEEDHMASHPDQTVEEIFFGTQTGTPILQVRLRGGETYLWNYAECSDEGSYLSCVLEGENGDFLITGNGDGTITLDIGYNDVLLERGGDQEIAFLSYDSGDDRSFLLYAGKGCIN